MKTKLFIRSTALFLCLAVSAGLCGCRLAAENPAGPYTDQTGQSNLSKEEGETQMKMNNTAAETLGEGPYIVRAQLREFTAIDPDKGIGVYGRYTELTAEENAPDTLKNTLAESNLRAEEYIHTSAQEIMTKAPSGSKQDEIQYVTCGYIVNVTRADETAFSLLETEYEKSSESSGGIVYRFHGSTYDTKSGEEIPLTDLVGDEQTCSGMLEEALSAKYGTKELVTTASSDYAWTADALGIRFYFNSDAVSREKRTELNDYTDRAITASLPYDVLAGDQAGRLSSVPESYIAAMDPGREYRLPHGKETVLLTKKEDTTMFRITQKNGKSEELEIEYGDEFSEYFIIRAAGGFYLFRQRTGYQEGFFYDFSRPDGGFGRFAYLTAQYFDSFMREIMLAVPYTPDCVHMAEVKRSFGEQSYDKSAFVPNGYYFFPSNPDIKYKRFVLLDDCLQIDGGNTACRLLEDFDAMEIDEQGAELGAITVPAGEIMVFESVVGEAPRYAEPPKRSQHVDFQYVCRLTDGRRIRFVSSTESTVSDAKGYLNRFTERVTLAEAQAGQKPASSAPAAEAVFTVRIGGKEYPLIPDYSLKGHNGEEIDFGQDIWWQVEDWPGRYVSTDEDFEEMRDAYFTQEALAHPDERAELIITEDGQVTLDFFGEIFKGELPEKRFYRTRPEIDMKSETQSRTFQAILREGEYHSAPVRIEFFSEGLPATNEPSKVPPLSVYLTRVPE